MNRFKNQLIAAAVLTVLAVIGTIMNLHQAVAQGPPGGMSVNIVIHCPASYRLHDCLGDGRGYAERHVERRNKRHAECPYYKSGDSSGVVFERERSRADSV